MSAFTRRWTTDCLDRELALLKPTSLPCAYCLLPRAKHRDEVQGRRVGVFPVALACCCATSSLSIPRMIMFWSKEVFAPCQCVALPFAPHTKHQTKCGQNKARNVCQIVGRYFFAASIRLSRAEHGRAQDLTSPS